MTADSDAALAGLVVLEISDSLSACFAASLLADFGAEVFVCEPLPGGSAFRSVGADTVRRQWWQVLGRNKKSIGIDPAAGDAAPIMRALLDRADLVVSDGGTRAGGTHPLLSLIPDAPGVSIVNVAPTGRDAPGLWPWSVRPEMAGAATGMMALTGWPDGPPMQPEMPLAEYLAGAFGAIRGLAEVRQRRLAGTAPASLDIPVHKIVQRMIEWQLAVAAAADGKPTIRDGNAFPLNAGIGNMHRTREGKYVAISAASEAMSSRLLEMVGGPELRNDPRFATLAARGNSLEAVYAIMDEWVARRTVAEVVEEAVRNDVVVGPIFDTEDILADPQLKARGNIHTHAADGAAAVTMPGIMPRIEGLEPTIRSLGPAVGQHTREILQRIGYQDERTSND